MILVTVTLKAHLVDLSWVRAQGDLIALAIDLAFLVFVACERPLVLL